MKVLTRPLLEKVCAKVLRDMRLPVEIASDSAGINLEALQAASGKGKGIKNKRTLARRGGRPFDHILLVGGATKTPAVRRFVENTFGRKPRPGLVNPDEVVALGAAVHAGSLEGLLAETETLGPMQASLIRAFAGKMRRERGEEAFDDLLVDADDSFDDEFEDGEGESMEGLKPIPGDEPRVLLRAHEPLSASSRQKNGGSRDDYGRTVQHDRRGQGQLGPCGRLGRRGGRGEQRKRRRGCQRGGR